MNTKRIITTFLLLFVAGSVVYAIVNETRHKTNASEQASNPPISNTGSSNTFDKVILYYFHGNARCRTCRKIEAYAHKALETYFPEELGSGKLVWRVVNIEEPSNRHFIRDYNLATRSLVVVEIKNNKQKKSKNLKRMWELVSDKDAFFTYVQRETRAYLEEED